MRQVAPSAGPQGSPHDHIGIEPIDSLDQWIGNDDWTPGLQAA